MKNKTKKIEIRFFQSDSGREYVREWLAGLPKEDRKIIGTDLMTVEFGWPVGMPVAEKIEANLWATRSLLPGKRYSRILFTIINNHMVLLHGFLKKSNRIELNDLKIARKRLKKVT